MTIITANYQKYLENKNFARASVKNYLCDARNLTEWVTNSGKDLAGLTATDFTLYIDSLIAKSESPSTVNRRRTSLKSFFDFLKLDLAFTPTPDLLTEYKKHLVSLNTPTNTIKNYLSDTRVEEE